MTRQEVLDILRVHMPEIKKRFGVKKLGIFGSVARDEATNGSDVDIIVEFEENRGSIKDVGGLYLYIKDILNTNIDILTTSSIKYIRYDEVKENIREDTIYVG